MKTERCLTSVFLILVGVALVVSPFLVFTLIRGAELYDNQRLIQISCALFALGVIVLQWIGGNQRPLLLSRTAAGLLGAFFLLGLASSATAYSPRHAFFEWGNLLLLLVVAWVIAAEVSTRGDRLLNKLLVAGGFACAAYVLLELLIYISVLKAGIQPSPRQLIVGYNNFRFFNHVQTTSLPLLGLLAARMEQPDRRPIWWGLVALWWMLLFVGLGRGTVVGVAAGIAVTWLLLGTAATHWCRALLWAGLAGLGAYLFFYVLIPVLMGMEPFGLLVSSVERSVDSPTSGRLQLWQRAWDMMLADPWLGAGPAHFAHYGRDLPNGNAHPHSWLLQFGSEWGIPALLAMVGSVVLAMRGLWQLRKMISPQDQDTLAALSVTGVAILVDGLVSGLLVVPTSQLWIAFYIGCAWGWTALRVPASKAMKFQLSMAGRTALSLVALLLTYVLLRGFWPDLQQQAAHPLDSKGAVYSPRILLDGRF